jgi:hypothetical protein
MYLKFERKIAHVERKLVEGHGECSRLRGWVKAYLLHLLEKR